MKQSFSIPATPSVARRLLKLREIVPSAEIDDELEALAEQGRVDPSIFQSFPPMDGSAEALVQDLIDFDLRAVVGVPTMEPEITLYPALAAASLAGITDVVFDVGHKVAKTPINIAESFGFSSEHVHFHSSLGILDEDSLIPRTAVYISTTRSYFDGAELPPGYKEFYRTIMFADEKTAKRMVLFPNMPNPALLYSITPDALGSRGFSNLTVSRAAVLFNMAFVRTTQRKDKLGDSAITL